MREAVWEDPEHVLVNTFNFERGEWRIHRLGVDGSSEQVLVEHRGRRRDAGVHAPRRILRQVLATLTRT